MGVNILFCEVKMSKFFYRKSNKGFTLVELIVVLVILAVLAGILTPALLGYIDQARSRRYFENAKTLTDAAQAMFTYQYAQNDKVPTGTPVVAGSSGSNNNGDQDITNTEFAKEVLKLAGLPDGTPYCFMIAVGSNMGAESKSAVAPKIDVSEADKYTIYYAFYVESENAKPWYFYNGTWTTTNPRYNAGMDKKKGIIDGYNYIQEGDLKGLRIQYYLIVNQTGKNMYTGDANNPNGTNIWGWMKAME